MKMKLNVVSLLVVFLASAPLLSAGEIERLRTLVAEQEMQIQQLELKIAQLTQSTAPAAIPMPASEEGLIPTAETCPAPHTSTGDSSTYTVQAGDNIVSIARKHSTTSAVLNELNNLEKDDIIRPGQILKLPQTAISVASTETSQTPVPAPSQPEAPATNTISHTVTSGETLYSIAKKHSVTIETLVKANPNIDPKTLRIGHVVQIPAKPQSTELTPVPKPEQTASLSGYNNIPISSQSNTVSTPRAADKPVKITEEISYSDFAKKYDTTTNRLDQLNGLRLDPTTVLAKGSELYIPAQP